MCTVSSAGFYYVVSEILSNITDIADAAIDGGLHPVDDGSDLTTPMKCRYPVCVFPAAGRDLTLVPFALCFILYTITQNITTVGKEGRPAGGWHGKGSRHRPSFSESVMQIPVFHGRPVSRRLVTVSHMDDACDCMSCSPVSLRPTGTMTASDQVKSH